jgi:AcrR family transcriptional regulator
VTETKEAPRSARRDATRERVLDAARDVFAERGVIGATVEEICDRAGFTRGAFYSNFEDKADVLEALIAREHARLLAHLDETLALVEEAGPGDEAELAPVVDRILGSVPEDRHLSLVQTELEIHAIREPGISRSFREADARFRERIARYIERGMALRGRELLIDPADLADAAVAIVARSVRRALLEGSGADPDAMARAVLPLLIAGASRPLPEAAGRPGGPWGAKAGADGDRAGPSAG